MIEYLRLINFRNQKDVSFDLNNSFVYINGKNGSGKTSILEAINYIATTKSHRTNNDLEVIRRGESFSKVILKTNLNTFELVLSDKGKVASFNGKEIRKLSDFISKLKVVFFAPEDLSLIKGSPSIRREFINIELTKLSKAYLNNLSKYNNILKQRNALLKNIKIDDDLTFLNILGNQLYDVGAKLINQRESFLNELNNFYKETYKSFNNKLVEIKYKPNLDVKSFENHLKNNQRQDILYETTMQGPHRDDFLFIYENVDAKNSSQGEQRLMVISLKLALVKLIKAKLKTDVYLLLDDVLSELDYDKQKSLLNNLDKDVQVIMNSAININSEKIKVIRLEGEETNE